MNKDTRRERDNRKLLRLVSELMTSICLNNFNSNVLEARNADTEETLLYETTKLHELKQIITRMCSRNKRDGKRR